RRAGGLVRHRPSECPALGYPGRHPRRLLRAASDGQAKRQRALLRPAQGLRGADRLPGPGEHLVQRARRAHRLPSRGGLRLLHAHRDGFPGPWTVFARQAGHEARRARPIMEERVRARLRSFGRGLAIVLSIVAVIAWRRHKLQKAEIEAALSAFSALLAQLWPDAFYWPERFWMPVAERLEKMNTAILMGAVYFVVVTPIALLQRLC